MEPEGDEGLHDEGAAKSVHCEERRETRNDVPGRESMENEQGT